MILFCPDCRKTHRAYHQRSRTGQDGGSSRRTTIGLRPIINSGRGRHLVRLLNDANVLIGERIPSLRVVLPGPHRRRLVVEPVVLLPRLPLHLCGAHGASASTRGRMRRTGKGQCAGTEETGKVCDTAEGRLSAGSSHCRRGSQRCLRSPRSGSRRSARLPSGAPLPVATGKRLRPPRAPPPPQLTIRSCAWSGRRPSLCR